MARMVKCLPFYLAEWELGTKIFFPTRDVKPYMPANLAPRAARAYAEELREAADLMDYWIRMNEEDKIRTTHHGKISSSVRKV